MNSNKEDILKVITKLIIEYYQLENITLTTVLAHTPIVDEWSEQIKLIDLSVDLEKELKMNFTIEEAMNWKTVGDVLLSCEKQK